jgi:L,D-peptidoglycan transpeptidase YkuD (ErfK/YbiS/YcfS/YnhG family)
MLTADSPPSATYDRALSAVSRARKAEAERYAPHILKGAESRLEEARFAWEMQNLKWSPRRDFTKMQRLCDDAIRRGDLAERRAVAVRDSLKSFTAARIDHVTNEIRAFQSYYGDVPVKAPARRGVTRSEVLVNESREAYKRGDFITSAARVKEAGKLIDQSASSSAKFLKDYMANLSQWKKWARETIDWSSREQSVAIVVDKIGRTCKVYTAGRLSAQYPIELGPNWIGDKQRRGDRATPEGRYHVRKKKGQGQTKYHLALEIDYPNEADLVSFKEAKRRGELSAGARIGGVIEIHGEGGRGENWTEGCVALRNDHMDSVYAVAEIGTPVTIVGALDPDALEKNNHAQKRNGR